jgi:hypothetical protein
MVEQSTDTVAGVPWRVCSQPGADSARGSGMARVWRRLTTLQACQAYSACATLGWGIWFGVFRADLTAPSVYAAFTLALPPAAWGWIAAGCAAVQFSTLNQSVLRRRLSVLLALAWWIFLTVTFALATWQVTAVPSYLCAAGFSFWQFRRLGGHGE